PGPTTPARPRPPRPSAPPPPPQLFAGGGPRAPPPAGGAPPPAIPEAEQLTLRRRPSLQAVNAADSLDPSGPRTVDLTAEDDTQTIPRLDSLERKLKDLEQQFG
ncbi:hypothetical protein ACFXPH_31295, partial [Streptomyces goshikiensis]